MSLQFYGSAKPFLRWAGGKARLLSFLERVLPPAFNESTYYEPFLGAGSLYFHLLPRKAVLSDNNKELIDCYKAVRHNPNLISRYLSEHSKKTCEAYYYKMRLRYNGSDFSSYKAALFIYLNKTCFNGIWRVNKKGDFNVPYGYRKAGRAWRSHL